MAGFETPPPCAATERHIVWDWNGTLFHDIDAVVAATNRLLAELDYRPITAEEHRRAFTRPVWVFYERILGRPLQDGEFEHLDNGFHEAYDRELARCALTRDAEYAMGIWRHIGRTQSLLSMWRHEELVPLVKKLDVEHYFLRVDGLRSDPGGRKAEHLVAHLEAIGAKPETTLLVGDSADDADAAASVGAHCVLYTGGYASKESLAETGAPLTDSLTEALAYC